MWSAPPFTRAFLARTASLSVPLAALLMALATTGCDLEVRAHVDVHLDDSHTLHVSYRSGAPSNAREPSRP